MNLQCVVVGVDGSDSAQRALEWAIVLAEATDARVVAVHALGLLDRIAGEQVITGSNRDEIVGAFERDWCAPLHASTVVNARIVLDGAAPDVLLETAAAEDADLIVVGARGRGAARLLGSTSRRVTEQAHRSVLVVQDPETRRRA